MTKPRSSAIAHRYASGRAGACFIPHPSSLRVLDLARVSAVLVENVTPHAMTALTGYRDGPPQTAPCLGEDSETVLRGLLGICTARYAAMSEAGITGRSIRDRPADLLAKVSDGLTEHVSWVV